MLQIVFNEISAAEVSQLDTLEQLELFDEFKVKEEDLEHLDDERFGKIERDGKTLYRFRSKDWRFYFEVVDGLIVRYDGHDFPTFSTVNAAWSDFARASAFVNFSVSSVTSVCSSSERSRLSSEAACPSASISSVNSAMLACTVSS